MRKLREVNGLFSTWSRSLPKGPSAVSEAHRQENVREGWEVGTGALSIQRPEGSRSRGRRTLWGFNRTRWLRMYAGANLGAEKCLGVWGSGEK